MWERFFKLSCQIGLGIALATIAQRILHAVGLVVLMLMLVVPVVADAATQDATVAWTASNPPATGYSVERAGAINGPYAQVGTTTAAVLTFTDANLAQGSTFCYRVIGLGTVGNSAPSTGVCTNTAGTPGVPGNVTVTITIKP